MLTPLNMRVTFRNQPFFKNVVYSDHKSTFMNKQTSREKMKHKSKIQNTMTNYSSNSKILVARMMASSAERRQPLVLRVTVEMTQYLKKPKVSLRTQQTMSADSNYKPSRNL